MFCRQCGSQIDDNADFCRFCGADMRPVKAAMQQAAPAMQPQQPVQPAPQPAAPAPEAPQPMAPEAVQPMEQNQQGAFIQDIPDNPYAEELEPVMPGEDGTTVLTGDAYIPGHAEEKDFSFDAPKDDFAEVKEIYKADAPEQPVTSEQIPDQAAAPAPQPQQPVQPGPQQPGPQQPGPQQNIGVVPVPVPVPNMGPGSGPLPGGPQMGMGSGPLPGGPQMGMGSGPLPGGPNMGPGSGPLVQTGALAQPGYKNGTGNIAEVSYQGDEGGVAVPPYNDITNYGKQELRTNRSLLKYILLGIVTFGIYDLWVMYTLTDDLNTLAYKHDGKKTMNVMLVSFLASCTLGISVLVWGHKMSQRIGEELQFRNIDYKFGASTFWLWNVLGSCIIVGPFIYFHKLMKSMNLLCKSYNLYD